MLHLPGQALRPQRAVSDVHLFALLSDQELDPLLDVLLRCGHPLLLCATPLRQRAEIGRAPCVPHNSRGAPKP
eukprot:9490812-Lingulodinium_polyedra.AAC.1